jgi:hypothetical protein
MVSKNLILAAAFFGLAVAQQNKNNTQNNAQGNQNNQNGQDAQNAQNGQNGQNNAATQTQQSGAQIVLDPSVVQTGSFFDGSDGLGAESTQALSATSKNNFIDFCKDKTLTNGLQIVQGSCNGIGMSPMVW